MISGYQRSECSVFKIVLVTKKWQGLLINVFMSKYEEMLWFLMKKKCTYIYNNQFQCQSDAVLMVSIYMANVFEYIKYDKIFWELKCKIFPKWQMC